MYKEELVLYHNQYGAIKGGDVLDNKELGAGTNADKEQK